MKRILSLSCFAIALMLATVTYVGCDSTTEFDTELTSPTAPNAAPAEDSNVSAPAERSNMTGSIKINGSSTVAPISDAVTENFNKIYPGVSVEVNGAGTGNGFDEFQRKQTDISDASRPIKPSELEKCKANGVEFIELPVAYDGLTIVVNPKNGWVDTLTVAQLKKIFVAGGEAKNWSDVDASWPEEKINIFSPGTGSGTYDYFREVVAKDESEHMRSDVEMSEEDNVLVQGVAGNKFSIGFFGVAYYEQNKDDLKAVKVVNPKDKKAYLPTRENIATNKYAPFSRPLFIYLSVASMNRAEVQTFVDYYLENTVELCEKVGYVRLPEDLMSKSRANFENEVIGTHFVDAEGNKRSGALTDIFKPETS